MQMQHIPNNKNINKRTQTQKQRQPNNTASNHSNRITKTTQSPLRLLVPRQASLVKAKTIQQPLPSLLLLLPMVAQLQQQLRSSQNPKTIVAAETLKRKKRKQPQQQQQQQRQTEEAAALDPLPGLEAQEAWQAAGLANAASAAENHCLSCTCPRWTDEAAFCTIEPAPASAPPPVLIAVDCAPNFHSIPSHSLWCGVQRNTRTQHIRMGEENNENEKKEKA